MRSRVHCPGHITGFFEICHDPDPVMAGSRGAGVVMDKGVETRVRADYADENIITCTVDGKGSDCPVTMEVAEEVMDLAPEPFEVNIEHRMEVPAGYGFGTSAAGALGTAFALNEALDLDLPETVCGRIAHRAEVVNRTGLGDVIAELAGGMVVRTQPGSPGVGRTERIPWEGEIVCFMVGPEMDTGQVLSSDKTGIISEVGAECLAKLLADMTPERFMTLSWDFAKRTGLASKEVEDAVAVLEKEGIPASMAMLGNTVFCLPEDAEKTEGLLDFPGIRAGASQGGLG